MNDNDDWKYTLVGLIIFFAICFLIADSSDNGGGGPDYRESFQYDEW